MLCWLLSSLPLMVFTSVSFVVIQQQKKQLYALFISEFFSINFIPNKAHNYPVGKQPKGPE
jgi:hypothetical protein